MRLMQFSLLSVVLFEIQIINTPIIFHHCLDRIEIEEFWFGVEEDIFQSRVYIDSHMFIYLISKCR